MCRFLPMITFTTLPPVLGNKPNWAVTAVKYQNKKDPFEIRAGNSFIDIFFFTWFSAGYLWRKHPMPMYNYLRCVDCQLFLFPFSKTSVLQHRHSGIHSNRWFYKYFVSLLYSIASCLFFFAVSLWFKFDSDYKLQVGSTYARRDPRLWTIGDPNSYRLQVSIAGHYNADTLLGSYYRLRLRTISESIPATEMATFNSPDQWIFVAFSYSSVRQKMFFLVDQTVVWEGDVYDQIAAYTTPLAIGNDVTPTRSFPGVLDEFYVYSRAATIDEAKVSCLSPPRFSQQAPVVAL